EGAAASLFPGSIIDRAAKLGRPVIVVDPRGVGETEQKHQAHQGSFFGMDQEDVQSAYILGESYLGMRIEDILRAVRYAVGDSNRGVDLYAEGQIAVAALHAAFLEPTIIKQTHLKNCLGSWQSILQRERSYQQLANVVHGVLLKYDLPQLKQVLGNSLTNELPVDSLGFEDMPNGAPLPQGYNEPSKAGLVGTFFGSSSFRNPQGEYPLDSLFVHYDNAVDKRGNDWSGIWVGYLLAPVSGDVRFSGMTDQALSLSIDGEPVLSLDDFPGTRTGVFRMEKGRLYPVTVRYKLPSGGKGMFEIKWSWQGMESKLVDRDYLRHSSAQVSELRQDWR
ncbi:MAG: hypothetical protein KJT03_12325, partial [Verrucomicrobiae bacterium]|nr:hypothetical protein [Verrucomicrobiae bacterium]